MLFLVSPAFCQDMDNSQTNNRLFFISPLNGQSVNSPVMLKFGIIGMDVVPAGVNKPMSGHHHLLVNLKELPDMNRPIPSDKNHLHFGKGQTEATIDLPKGKHTLQLLLGNHNHVPHNPPLLSEKIEILVK